MVPLDVVTRLNECANTDFVSMRDWWFGVVSCAAALVAFGLVLEAPELVHDLRPMGRKIIASSKESSIEFPRHEAPDWVKVVAFVGWIFIVVGVVGEQFAGVKVKDLDANIQECSDAKVRAVTIEAGNAKTSALDAATAAGRARDHSDKAVVSASNAMSIASSARREADSFEKDIVSAKTQAATAESHLAEALKQAADATAELKRLKSPRSLINEPELVSALAPFKGVKYMFSSVFGDEESIDLLKQIDGMLQRAGWKICQPGSSCQPGGPFPPALNVFSNGTTLGVSLGVTTGIAISVESTESIQALRALPADELPPNVRAALALRSNLSSSISPSPDSGVNKTVNVVSGKDPFVLITVGKKP